MKIYPNTKIKFEIERCRKNHPKELQNLLNQRGINIVVERVFSEELTNRVWCRVELKPEILYKFVEICDGCENLP
jgi:hypothetical protein